MNFRLLARTAELALSSDSTCLLSHVTSDCMQMRGRIKNFASFLVTVLKPISTNQFTIKDSFTFVDWAKSYKHNHETMCSFDVCSLFTNVPLNETIKFVLPNYILFLILLHYHEQSSKICLSLRRRKATSYLMGNII